MATLVVAGIGLPIAAPAAINELRELVDDLRQSTPPTNEPGSTTSTAPPTSGTSGPTSSSSTGPTPVQPFNDSAVAVDLGEVGPNGARLQASVGPQSSVELSMPGQVDWLYPNQPSRCAVSIGSSSMIDGGVFYSGLPNGSGWTGAEIAPLPEGAVPHMQALYLPADAESGNNWTLYPVVTVGGESFAGNPFTISVVERSGSALTLDVDAATTTCVL